MIHNMSVLKLNDGLYVFTCVDGCGRSFSVDLDEDGHLDIVNKVIIKEGDMTVQHSSGLGGRSIVGVEVE